MIQKITIGILIAVDIMLCGLCVWAFRTKHASAEKLQEDKDRTYKTELLENELKYGLVNNYLPLDEATTVINSNKEELLLKDVIGEKTKLCIRISDTYCEDCMRFVFVKTLRLAQQNGWMDDRIIVLATWRDARSLSIFADRIGVKFPIYQIEALPLPAEETHAPYCFTLNNTMKIG